jgi:hypothetical protein
MFPAFGVAAQVHHRQDQELVGPELIKQAERKVPHAAAASSRRYRQPRLGMGFNQTDCCFHLHQKLETQSGVNSRVVIDSLRLRPPLKEIWPSLRQLLPEFSKDRRGITRCQSARLVGVDSAL